MENSANTSAVKLSPSNTPFERNADGSWKMPNFMPGVHFDPVDDYALTSAVRGTPSSQKLAESFVAPLIAQARPYTHVIDDAVDPKHILSVTSTLGRARWRKVEDQVSHRAFLKRATTGGSCMVMQWHQLAEVASASAKGENPEPAPFYQARPNIPIPAKAKGDKALKYINISKTQAVLDVHPSVDAGHLAAPTILFAEGLLKADAAFTAYLLANGATKEDLLVADPRSNDEKTSRYRIQQLLAKIPEEKRVLIVALVGVGNWHKSASDWNAMTLKGKRCLIAFDGDTATNRAVNLQAKKLGMWLDTRAVAETKFITIPQSIGKDGLDDYFAEGHSFEDLDSLCGDLPPTPEPKVFMSDIEMPVVDELEGITYETVKIETPDGPAYRKEVLVEAAVVVEENYIVTKPYEDTPVSRRMSGRVVYRSRRGGETVINEMPFKGQDADILERSNVNPATSVADLTDGRARVRSSAKAARQVHNAWAVGMDDGDFVEYVEHVGLWHDHVSGKFGYLCSDGLLTKNGMYEGVKARPNPWPKTDIRYMDNSVEANRETVDAWLLWKKLRAEINPKMHGLAEAMTGLYTIAGLGVQPEGALAIFGPPQMGKSTTACGFAGFKGRAYMTDAGGLLPVAEKTGPRLRVPFLSQTGGSIMVDDAFDARDTDGGTSKDFEGQRKFMISAVRSGYELAQEPAVQMQTKYGTWDTLPRTQPHTRGVVILGESWDRMGFNPSTQSRAIAWTYTQENPLLTTNGTIVSTLDEIREANALCTLFSATLSHTISEALWSASVDERGVLMDHMKERIAHWMGRAKELHPSVRYRVLELISPVLAGYEALINTVELAIMNLIQEAEENSNTEEFAQLDAELTEVQAEADAFVGKLLAALDTYEKGAGAAAAGNGYKRIFEVISDGLTSDTLYFGDVEPYLDEQGQPVKEHRTLIGLRKHKVLDDGTVDRNLVIIPTALAEAYRKAKNIKKYDTDMLREDLGSAFLKKGVTQVINGKKSHGRWLIDGNLFAEVTGFADRFDLRREEREAREAEGKSNVISFTVKKTIPSKPTASASGW